MSKTFKERMEVDIPMRNYGTDWHATLVDLADAVDKLVAERQAINSGCGLDPDHPLYDPKIHGKQPSDGPETATHRSKHFTNDGFIYRKPYVLWQRWDSDKSEWIAAAAQSDSDYIPIEKPAPVPAVEKSDEEWAAGIAVDFSLTASDAVQMTEVLLSRFGELRKEIATAHERVQELVKLYQEKRKDVEFWQAAFTKEDADCDKLESEVSRRFVQLCSQDKKIAELQADLSTAQAKVRELEEGNRQLVAQISRGAERLSELHDELSRLRGQGKEAPNLSQTIESVINAHSYITREGSGEDPRAWNSSPNRVKTELMAACRSTPPLPQPVEQPAASEGEKPLWVEGQKFINAKNPPDFKGWHYWIVDMTVYCRNLEMDAEVFNDPYETVEKFEQGIRSGELVPVNE